MSTSIIIVFAFLLIVLIILSATFSAAEFAYASMTKSVIESKIKKHKRSAKLIKKHYHKFGWTLATILISNNVVNIATSSITTYLLTMLMGASTLVTVISILVVTPIIVILGEILPKLLAKKFAYQYLSFVVYLIEFLNWLFFPITFPLARLALSLKITNSESDLKQLLGVASSEGVLQIEEATLAQKALDLDSQTVGRVMVKLENIDYLESTLQISEAKERFALTTHSRMPIMQGGNFIGMLLFKDIAFEDEEQHIAKFAKPICFVSKNIVVTKALEKMRANRTQIALVIDSIKNHNVVGLVTVEDIIEELVGEIYDEHDVEKSVREIAHYKWVAYGNVPLSDVKEEIGMNFKDDLDMELKTWLAHKSKNRLKKNLKIIFERRWIFKVIIFQKNKEPLIQISKKHK